MDFEREGSQRLILRSRTVSSHLVDVPTDEELLQCDTGSLALSQRDLAKRQRDLEKPRVTQFRAARSAASSLRTNHDVLHERGHDGGFRRAGLAFDERAQELVVLRSADPAGNRAACTTYRALRRGRSCCRGRPAESIRRRQTRAPRPFRRFVAKSLSVETLAAHGCSGPPGCAQPKYISVCSSPRLCARPVMFAGPYLFRMASRVRLCDSHIIVGSASFSRRRAGHRVRGGCIEARLVVFCAAVPTVGDTHETVVVSSEAEPLSTSISACRYGSSFNVLNGWKQTSALSSARVLPAMRLTRNPRMTR